MKTLKKKLNSSLGATIMMSLLLMLVCMMVGASILMASASNAGKVKSNKVEQQKYFAVSSALTSVCDTLTADARYVGRYDYTRVESWEKMTTGTNSSGDPVEEKVLKSTTHTYTQKLPGLLTVDGKDSDTSGTGTMAVALTSLLRGMDDIFSEKFPVADGVASWTWTFHVADPTVGNGAALTAEDEEDGGEEEAPVEMPVDITAKLEANGRIVLNAVLADASGRTEYRMSAMLRPAVLVTDPDTGESTKQDGLSLLAPDEKLATASSNDLVSTSTTYEDGIRSWTDAYEKTGQSTLPVVWELEYIKKGAVE